MTLWSLLLQEKKEKHLKLISCALCVLKTVENVGSNFLLGLSKRKKLKFKSTKLK